MYEFMRTVVSILVVTGIVHGVRKLFFKGKPGELFYWMALIVGLNIGLLITHFF
jgi:sorbitol-specific phosphotransferase system component IIC